MASFPKSEAEIVALGHSLASGLTADASIFTDPPVAPVQITSLLTAFNTAQHNVEDTRGNAEAAVAAKLETLQALIDAMKKDLRYAEYTCNYDDALLKQLGWGTRREPSSLQAPGQALELAASIQGEGTVSFSWKKPADGGAVAAYMIQRRVRPDGAWTNVATAMKTEITLENQERKIEWEFRIIAANKAGEGMPSNTVMVVL
jgi:hypothetical protein